MEKNLVYVIDLRFFDTSWLILLESKDVKRERNRRRGERFVDREGVYIPPPKNSQSWWKDQECSRHLAIRSSLLASLYDLEDRFMLSTLEVKYEMRQRLDVIQLLCVIKACLQGLRRGTIWYMLLGNGMTTNIKQVVLALQTNDRGDRRIYIKKTINPLAQISKPHR